MEKKKKEPIFFKDIELVDLDDCDVPDMRLQCDSNDTDDNNAPNQEDMDVGDIGVTNSQCLERNTGPATETLQSSIQVHSDHPSEATPFVHDLLFNAIGKAPHLL